MSGKGHISPRLRAKLEARGDRPATPAPNLANHHMAGHEKPTFNPQPVPCPRCATLEAEARDLTNARDQITANFEDLWARYFPLTREVAALREERDRMREIATKALDLHDDAWCDGWDANDPAWYQRDSRAGRNATHDEAREWSLVHSSDTIDKRNALRAALGETG